MLDFLLQHTLPTDSSHLCHPRFPRYCPPQAECIGHPSCMFVSERSLLGGKGLKGPVRDSRDMGPQAISGARCYNQPVLVKKKMKSIPFPPPPFGSSPLWLWARLTWGGFCCCHFLEWTHSLDPFWKRDHESLLTLLAPGNFPWARPREQSRPER